MAGFDGRGPLSTVVPRRAGTAFSDLGRTRDGGRLHRERRLVRAGEASVWTETRLRVSSIGSTYDLAPDGKRLAAFAGDDASGEKLPTHLTFLLNFFDELRRKAPEGK